MDECHAIGLKLICRETEEEYHLIAPKFHSLWYTMDTYSAIGFKLINTWPYTVDEYRVILQTRIKRQSDNVMSVVMPC